MEKLKNKTSDTFDSQLVEIVEMVRKEFPETDNIDFRKNVALVLREKKEGLDLNNKLEKTIYHERVLDAVNALVKELRKKNNKLN